MSRARIAFALAALAAGVAVVLVVTDEGIENSFDAALGVGVGWVFIASGLVAWARRPESSIGVAMVVAGFLRLGGEFCVGSEQPLLFPVGHLLHAAFWIAVAYVLLVFPSGRPSGALSRWILVGAGLLLSLRLAWVLVGGESATNALAITERPNAVRSLDHAESVIGLLLGGLLIVALARSWGRASPRLRFAIAPVLWTGAAGFGLFLLMIPVMIAGDQVGGPLSHVPMVAFDLALGTIAVGFLVGLLRARLARSAVAELVVDLGETAAPGDLRDALARALRDPSLELAYWLPDGGRYVDVDGRPFEPPAADMSRAVSVAEREGRTIALLVHDPALDEEPELVESVCAAAALALENERLQAELRARLEDLRASRARIVDAADTERRRIERNLHDGAQQRLVSIAMTLGLAEVKAERDPAGARTVFGEARQGLLAALGELRELSHGIHPAILTERGLTAALDELTLRSGVPVELSIAETDRLPEHVEAAGYYVVSEALANVAKYAHATSARVRVERVDGWAVVEVTDDGVGGADAGRGSGLRGLTDRVEALGGRLKLWSPPGEGTIVRAELPCA